MASVVNATANYSFVNISGNFQINLKRSQWDTQGSGETDLWKKAWSWKSKDNQNHRRQLLSLITTTRWDSVITQSLESLLTGFFYLPAFLYIT